MKTFKKYDYPVDDVRRFLEPGPIVMVSSLYKGEQNIMTMGWYMIAWESPSLIQCMIWDQNHSHNLIRRSKECVINLPTVELTRKVVSVGNSSGREGDKFKRFGLTPEKGKIVNAPLIRECYANFECKLIDSSQIKKYNLFMFEVVAAQAAKNPKFPTTIHYRGDGLFMISGKTTSRYRKYFSERLLNG